MAAIFGRRVSTATERRRRLRGLWLGRSGGAAFSRTRIKRGSRSGERGSRAGTPHPPRRPQPRARGGREARPHPLAPPGIPAWGRSPVAHPHRGNPQPPRHRGAAFPIQNQQSSINNPQSTIVNLVPCPPASPPRSPRSRNSSPPPARTPWPSPPASARDPSPENPRSRRSWRPCARSGSWSEGERIFYALILV